MTNAGSGAGAKAPGRLSKALIGLFMKRATVVAIDDVADRFRLVTLEGAALRGVAWIPGQKVQIAIGSAFVARTYTPIELDSAAGRARILGYGHGDGPGSAWLTGLNVGDECDLFGPRNSLAVHQLIGPLAVFGDETSIGVAYALARQDRARAISCYFEVGEVAGAERVGTRLDLENVTLFAQRGDDTHLAQLESVLLNLVEAGASFVLTGKAGTVQWLRQELKRRGVSANRVATKAYWAPRKTGLD
ncbi:MAG: siderophore-interacting protein [Stutzerimonas stutzeri]|nr:MAG: siderophore-interacting protein [Stutzerimonas stutzeri]